MATRWTEIPIDAKLFTNVDPTSNTRTLTGLENCFVSEAGSHSRFPGLIERVNFGDSDPVYLKEYEGDLVAVTSKGRFYRIGSDYSYEDVTAVPVAGGRRPVFAETDDGTLYAVDGLKAHIYRQAPDGLFCVTCDFDILCSLRFFFVARKVWHSSHLYAP